jgi:putative phosphoesterase
LGQGLEGTPLHIVWGNNDGDPFLISKVAQSFPHIELHGQLAELDLDGFSVAVNHYPRIGQALAKSGMYNLVCFGHDHKPHDSWVGNSLLLNPGELMGLHGKSTFALVDVENRKVEHIIL